MRKEVLRTDNVTYDSGGVRFLDMFRLHVFTGEIMGIFFVDNHGKNEFVDIITENIGIDFGNIYFKDILINTHASPRPRHNSGVALISGADTLIENMSVAENVFVMRHNFKKYLIDPEVLKAQFRMVADEFDIGIDGARPARDLSDLDKYIVRLLKAAITGNSLVIVKDIGNYLEAAELNKFYGYMQRFSKREITFLYVSDHFRELFSVCDRVAISERGQVINILQKKDFNSKYLKRYFFDPKRIGKVTESRKDSVIRFDHVSGGGLRDIDFSVGKGECVLFWDQHDKAIRDIVDFITGRTKPECGEVRYQGIPVLSHGLRSRKKINFPVSVIRETPAKTMIIGDMSYLDNLCFHTASRFPTMWLRKTFRENIRNEYLPLIGEAIDAADPFSVSSESLYDLVYYREHIFSPRLIVIVQPFLETDMKLKIHIISLIEKLRENGASLLILDNNMTESSFMADRILVVSRGELINEIGKDEADESST